MRTSSLVSTTRYKMGRNAAALRSLGVRPFVRMFRCSRPPRCQNFAARLGELVTKMTRKRFPSEWVTRSGLLFRCVRCHPVPGGVPGPVGRFPGRSEGAAMSVERGFDHAAPPPTAALPRKLADILRPELASLAAEIVDEIRATIPAYARPLDGPYGKSIRAGVEYAITLFVAQIADPTVSKEQSHEVHHRLGQNEMREGRSLDTLQSAYRVGARVSWRRIMRVGRRSGLSSAVMSQLADAMLAFMDELASVALDGYLEAKARTAGALDTWRRKLLHLILETPPASPKAIAELAQLIGWPVPSEATPVAVCPADGVAPARRHAGLDADILAELDTPDPKLVIPGELGGARLATLQVALPDCRLSIGPCVPLASVADSLRWARNALQLADRGVLAPRPVLRAEEHLATLLVNSDTGLVGTLRHRLFAPLADMTGKQ